MQYPYGVPLYEYIQFNMDRQNINKGNWILWTGLHYVCSNETIILGGSGRYSPGAGLSFSIKR